MAGVSVLDETPAGVKEGKKVDSRSFAWLGSGGAVGPRPQAAEERPGVDPQIAGSGVMVSGNG